MRRFIGMLFADPSGVSKTERVRSIAGTALGILVAGLLAAVLFHHDPAAMGLTAPMGAAAVLLFATPSSPLAQPWPVIGGSFLSAVAVVTVY